MLFRSDVVYFGSWVAKICGRCCRHWLTMEVTNRFFAKMVVFSGVFISEVALSTRDEVEEFVVIIGRVEEESVEVESQDEEGWGLSDESSLSL